MLCNNWRPIAYFESEPWLRRALREGFLCTDVTVNLNDIKGHSYQDLQFYWIFVSNKHSSANK